MGVHSLRGRRHRRQDSSLIPVGVGPSSLLTGLEFHYALEDASDSHADNTLTNTNDVTFTSGKLNNAATFDGTNYLSGPSISIASGQWSFSFWAKITGSTAALGGSLASQHMEFWIDGGKLDFYWKDSGDNWQHVLNNTTITDGNWHHIVASCDSETVSVIVDNGTPATGAWVSGLAGNFDLGLGSYRTIDFLIGQLDEFGYRTRPLTSEEITALHGDGTPPAYPFPGILPA